MAQDLLEYPKLVENAMRTVVREALRLIGDGGLPGLHHFYITFRTQDKGVEITDTVAAQYPDEMTIVLEHQFWNLEITDDRFGVTLSFGGNQERLVIPFSAVTAFVDPSVKFGLQFGGDEGTLVGTPMAEADMDTDTDEETDDHADPAESATNPDAPESSDGTVVALDSFRKK
tara:strand:+ start:119 stop:637 length:519 start_codon:yes stop_codon:yes gene_type:complete